MPASRWAFAVVAAGAACLLVVAGFSGALSQWTRPAAPAPMVVGVFFPGTDEASWSEFVLAVRAGADAHGMTFRNHPEAYECVVETTPRATVFRWYPEVGSRGMQRRVAELCRQPQPPLALIGATNSSLTLALANALAEHGRADDAPLLLMTDSTADPLTKIHKDRSFRFGFRNSHQATVVTERLREHLIEKARPSAPVNALLVQVLDNPFTMDLIEAFERELRERVDAEIVPPTDPVFLAPASGAGGEARRRAWSLPTAYGAFDDPSDAENNLARALVERMLRELDKEWVLALPLGSMSYRRMAYALTRALDRHSDGEAVSELRRRLTVIAGDSLHYRVFSESRRQAPPEESPAPVIFFAHEDPTPSTPYSELLLLLTRVLLPVMAEVADAPRPSRLAEALARCRGPDDRSPLFRGPERADGGAAIVAIPKPEMSSFELRMPKAW